MSTSLSEINSELGKRLQALRELKTALGAIERLDKDRAANAVDIQQRLSKVRKLLGVEFSRSDVMTAMQGWLTSYERDIETALQAWRQRFGAELDRLLRAEGMELSGQVPQLKAGLFTLEPDFDSGHVVLWYGPKQEQLAVVRPSPHEVLKRLQASRKELSSRPFNEQQFLKQLFGAYQHALRREGKGLGEHTSIGTVLVELSYIIQDRRFYVDPRKEYFRGYSRAQFSYDLYRLRQRRLLDRELALVTATRAYTSRRQDFLWVPSNDRGDGAAYSHLYFKEAR